MDSEPTSLEVKRAVEAKSVNRANGTTKVQTVIVWRNVIFFVFLHSALFYGLYAALVLRSWNTIIFATLLGFTSGLGVTAGAHRLWSHKSYKARLPLRIFLAIMQTVAGQNHIYEWCRDHRVHHKFSETDGDPHNAKRGFFFSHMGWLCVKKHPDVRTKGSTVDMSDLLEDPVVRFQKKYFYIMSFFLSAALPTCIPVYFWNEGPLTAFIVASMNRYCLQLHMTWLVNSAAHLWGNRPYDIKIGARENIFVAIGAIGEGFHNFHHTFPSDYSTSELGFKLNLTTCFINLMEYVGQAYDLKKTSPELVAARKRKALLDAKSE